MTDENHANSLAAIQWAPRVTQQDVRRLYESDAHGLLDEELLDEIGIALYRRCEDILLIDEAKHGRVACPVCRRSGTGTIIQRGPARRTDPRDEQMTCPCCGWSLTWGEYYRTFQRKQLNLGGAGESMQAYMRDYERAESPRDKMLAVDRLIHAFHFSLRTDPELPTRAAGVNFIEGNLTNVLQFLDELGGLPQSRAVRTTHQEWQRHQSHLERWMSER